MGNKQAKPTKKKANAADLTEEEIELLLNNTHFNRKQIEEWHSGFIKDCPKGWIQIKKIFFNLRITFT
jgi:hypothetical protein